MDVVWKTPGRRSEEVTDVVLKILDVALEDSTSRPIGPTSRGIRLDGVLRVLVQTACHRSGTPGN